MQRSTVFLLALALCGLLAGCGGNHSFSTSASKRTGRATFTIQWPARLRSPDQARLIPDAANSIKVEVKNGNASVGVQILPRPAGGQTSTATFDPLPVGSLTVTATAYPQADGTGTAQATATAPLVIQANQNTPFSLTMNSTIDHLEITPSPATVSVGQTLPLTVTAKDANGAVILFNSAKLQWSAGNTTAAVDANSVLSGLTLGTTNFTVTEQESGKSASVNVLVIDATTSFPISVTGFNRDVIFEVASTTTATAFDDSTTAWIENGLNNRAGLPTGVFTSRLPNSVTSGNTQYQLQPFTGNNVLMLTDTNTQGTLTLNTTARFRALSIAAASSNARFVAGIGTLTLNFTDGSTSGAINYNARDWWGEGANNDPNRILSAGVYRSANIGTDLPSANVQIDTFFTGYNLYETTIDLSNINGGDYSHKMLQSVTFNRAVNAERTGIFAMSGVATIGP